MVLTASFSRLSRRLHPADDQCQAEFERRVEIPIGHCIEAPAGQALVQLDSDLHTRRAVTAPHKVTPGQIAWPKLF